MFDAWKQRQRQRLETRPERTVFYNIFATMMLVLAVELLMAVASILAINVTEQLDENAKDLLTMRVRNRASYVQEILRNAEDLEQLSEQITATTQQLLKSGDISLDTLDNGSEQSDAQLVALDPQQLPPPGNDLLQGLFLVVHVAGQNFSFCLVDPFLKAVQIVHVAFHEALKEAVEQHLAGHLVVRVNFPDDGLDTLLRRLALTEEDQVLFGEIEQDLRRLCLLADVIPVKRQKIIVLKAFKAFTLVFLDISEPLRRHVGGRFLHLRKGQHQPMPRHFTPRLRRGSLPCG